MFSRTGHLPAVINILPRNPIRSLLTSTINSILFSSAPSQPVKLSIAAFLASSKMHNREWHEKEDLLLSQLGHLPANLVGPIIQTHMRDKEKMDCPLRIELAVMKRRRRLRQNLQSSWAGTIVCQPAPYSTLPTSHGLPGAPGGDQGHSFPPQTSDCTTPQTWPQDNGVDINWNCGQQYEEMALVQNNTSSIGAFNSVPEQASRILFEEAGPLESQQQPSFFPCPSRLVVDIPSALPPVHGPCMSSYSHPQATIYAPTAYFENPVDSSEEAYYPATIYPLAPLCQEAVFDNSH
jgi:hypothetical protein